MCIFVGFEFEVCIFRGVCVREVLESGSIFDSLFFVSSFEVFGWGFGVGEDGGGGINFSVYVVNGSYISVV